MSAFRVALRLDAGGEHTNQEPSSFTVKKQTILVTHCILFVYFVHKRKCKNDNLWFQAE